ncbi:hypothetical protein AB0C28_41140 [Nonomuraea sp. NPDC048892]|uniref:hypothetical protein n=1 Tax=Nonomuraea sp. NPDC048892 TaxID=3154624 RepID=UPI0033F0CF32
MSQTPVREALRQLIHERVVVRTGPRSLQIARYDPETLDEIAETEARLRGLVARFAARKRSQALVSDLYESLTEADMLVAGLIGAQRDGRLGECARRDRRGQRGAGRASGLHPPRHGRAAPRSRTAGWAGRPDAPRPPGVISGSCSG